ncbi:MAG: family 16 glycosylhydrolase [Pseudomonadota bacterium]|nr:family 16 glycosylhydrolase [Pseudomonadota bacterium]
MMLAICAVLTVLLTSYSFAHYFSAFVFLTSRKKQRVFEHHPELAVSVLIPARNEGERALRVITSVLEQDHTGPIDTYLLLKDDSDSSIPFFLENFPGVELRVPAPATIEILRSSPNGGPARTVTLVYTGADAKSEKVNWMTARLATRHMAILDCDHQAHPDWIRSSLALMLEQRAPVIQGRRAPISARGFYQLWDSLHQHVGCELFNTAFTRLDLTVFFTGTTAVLETALLKGRPLSGCITEDVDFSYTIVLRGSRIIANPFSGSNEETSPDLYSFLARRRRWANGHTQAFLSHLPLFWSAPLSLKQRTQFLFHGTHYLVSIVVFVLHLVIGLIFLGGMSGISQGSAVLSSLMLAIMTARTQRTIGWATRTAEVAVVFGWLFPAVVIAMNIVQAVLLNDFSRAALPIPYALQAVGLIGLVAPLTVLLVGLVGFRQLGLGTLLATVLTYPLAFYLDICGVLLGILDYASGRARWRAVSRSQAALPGRRDPARLLTTLDLKESWSMGTFLASARDALHWADPRKLKPAAWLSTGVLLSLFCSGVLYIPSTRIDVHELACTVLPHDTDPWIVPASKLTGYCDAASTTPRWTQRNGTFQQTRDDELTTVDPTYWDQLHSTFFCNEAAFAPENVLPLADGSGGGIRLQLENRASSSPNGDRAFTSGSIATKDEDDKKFLFGRFEAVLKPAKASGVLTAFFLYRFDPWQEIDFEFLGKDPTKVLLNVYYNPGEEGDLYNYGHLGTPVVIDLGFDASEDFHRYAIEWEADELRWFVDDKLIHVRSAGRPTPIPHLPMRFHVNAWPCCSEALVGPFSAASLPASADVRSVRLSRWYPSPLPTFLTRLASFFPASGNPSDWRQNAPWLQP